MSHLPSIFNSERTIEANVLHELAKCFEQNGRLVTIIAPTQVEELDLGYDDTFLNLPYGKTLALQFKKPIQYDNAFTKFIISIPQLQTLRSVFQIPNQAYYVFSPFPTRPELLTARSQLLHRTAIVDVHSNSFSNLSGKKRTILVNETNAAIIAMMFNISNRQYVSVNGVQRSDILCPGTSGSIPGRPAADADEKYKKDLSDKKSNKIKSDLSGTYLIHISGRSRR